MKPSPKVAEALENLNEQEAAFLLAYEGNGYNGAAAYMATHPKCKSSNSAAVLAHKLLRRAKVAEAQRTLRAVLLAEHEMTAGEAVALTAMRARADLAQAYDDDGKELPFHKWPRALRVAVKGRKADGTLMLVDPQRATDTILQMHGKLKSTVDLTFDHLAYLTAKQEEYEAAAAARGATEGDRVRPAREGAALRRRPESAKRPGVDARHGARRHAPKR